MLKLPSRECWDVDVNLVTFHRGNHIKQCSSDGLSVTGQYKFVLQVDGLGAKDCMSGLA